MRKFVGAAAVAAALSFAGWMSLAPARAAPPVPAASHDARLADAMPTDVSAQRRRYYRPYRGYYGPRYYRPYYRPYRPYYRPYYYRPRPYYYNPYGYYRPYGYGYRPIDYSYRPYGYGYRPYGYGPRFGFSFGW